LLLLLRCQVVGLHGEQRGRCGCVWLRATAAVVERLSSARRPVDYSTIGENVGESASLTESAATLI